RPSGSGPIRVRGLPNPCWLRPRIWLAPAVHPSPRRNPGETIRSYVACMNVELVRWPGDPQRLADLRDRGVPRLLLVADDTEPPMPTDCLEDWVPSSAPETYLDARRRGLQTRARAHGARPDLDGDGLLRHRDLWVSLSPVEQS